MHPRDTEERLEAQSPDPQANRPTVNYDQLVGLGSRLLIALGEDPIREGLRGTPRRWANLWRDFIEYDPGNTSTTFEIVTVDQMIVVSGIRVYSLCEHHLIPFWCDISIGYVTRDKVLGLSKFARIAHQCAHRLQLQERLVDEIASHVSILANSPDVAVLAKGTHLCTIMRGIQTPSIMTTSVMRGVFLDNDAARAEFLRIVADSAPIHNI